MLIVKEVSFKRSGREVIAAVNLSVARGEAVGLVGANGAGKSTLFQLIIGARACAGSIFLDEVDICRLPTFERARLGLGYLPQEPSLFRGLTVEQNLLLTLEAVEGDRVRRFRTLEILLRIFLLTEVRHRSAAKLSGGEQRRCEIARTMAARPSFVLLDEPFAKLDPIAIEQTARFIRLFARMGIGVLVSDHNLHALSGAVSRAYILDYGRITAELSRDKIQAAGVYGIKS